MIIADQKPISELVELVSYAKSVLVVGCGTCVTVCMAGGEKEAGILSTALRMYFTKEGQEKVIDDVTITRQCEPEFVESLAKKVEPYDCILSLACGVGVQFLAERYTDKWVVPGLNTKGAGGTIRAGWWEERCGVCGDCILYRTGGICPIIRCSKSLLNGPCGGSQGGKCEVSSEIPCAWQLIYDRLKGIGKLELMYEFNPPKDWSKARDGGLRRIVREDVMV